LGGGIELPLETVIELLENFLPDGDGILKSDTNIRSKREEDPRVGAFICSKSPRHWIAVNI
jgi:hypothetical protein